MMVETILESSQDFGAGMSSGAGAGAGALPQWKRELLQRRAARSRPTPPPAPPPPPPPPPPADDDEELRYGPGIVKRLKSRYLSLALRDAPRRRASVLRRAASLEHLLDERPPPAPRALPLLRPPRPASLAAPLAATAAPAPRRDFVKRARSVDALSRLDSRDEPPPPPLAPRPPPQPRSARPPRRPTPLLRDAERPPPDVVRSTLRKFESAPTRRAAPAARVSAVLRGLEGPQRTSTPEPRDGREAPPPRSPRTPSPSAPEASAAAVEPERAGSRPVSRAALEGIARAGSTVRYSFPAACDGSHLPLAAAANPVLVGRARRVGVIRPMPARGADGATSPTADDAARKSPEPPTRLASPSPPPPELEPATAGRTERRDPPPAALVEPIPRPPPEPIQAGPPSEPSPEPKTKRGTTVGLVNGHAPPETEIGIAVSKIGAAGIERAWSGSGEVRGAGGARRGRAPPPAATSVVFNFCNRKEVPDYIENDGIILRANRKNRIKAGEPGVVVLRPEALAAGGDSGSECEEVDCGPPSPCRVRFVNDNVLINGRSSMPHRPDPDRIAKLKLQFDDSLTRTFEYPSETSLCEEPAPASSPASCAAPAPAPAPAPASAPSPQLAESPLHATLAANTHIASAALSNYTPSKTVGEVFQLGVTRHEAHADDALAKTKRAESPADEECAEAEAEAGGAGGAGGACGAAARSWSEARTHATDLLF